MRIKLLLALLSLLNLANAIMLYPCLGSQCKGYNQEIARTESIIDLNNASRAQLESYPFVVYFRAGYKRLDSSFNTLSPIYPGVIIPSANANYINLIVPSTCLTPIWLKDNKTASLHIYIIYSTHSELFSGSNPRSELKIKQEQVYEKNYLALLRIEESELVSSVQRGTSVPRVNIAQDAKFPIYGGNSLKSTENTIDYTSPLWLFGMAYEPEMQNIFYSGMIYAGGGKLTTVGTVKGNKQLEIKLSSQVFPRGNASRQLVSGSHIRFYLPAQGTDRHEFQDGFGADIGTLIFEKAPNDTYILWGLVFGFDYGLWGEKGNPSIAYVSLANSVIECDKKAACNIF